MNIYFENIRIINPYQEIDGKFNLWIKNGQIVHLSPDSPELDDETRKINADGLVCSPGLFDMHVHFREPGYEYKETILSGAESAANGGFTAVVCMPNTKPAIDDVPVYEYIVNRAKGNLVDVFVAGAITKGRKGKSLSPMLELLESGVVYFTDDGTCITQSEVMRRAFDYAATKDILLAQHCEEHSLTEDFAMDESALSYKLGLKGYPRVAEEIIVSRDIRLAEYCGNRRIHFSHVSSAGSVELIRTAKAKGQRVSCEVTPHHISLSHNLLDSYDPNLKMNPPLRSEQDIEAIIEGLKDGTIDCIATDHAPHSLHEKEVEYERAPYGVVGLETSLGLSLTYLYHKDVLSLREIVEKMAVNPRRLLNIADIIFEAGLQANMTIFDPDEEWQVNKSNFKSKSLNTPFDGMSLKGKPKFAISNGQIYESNL